MLAVVLEDFDIFIIDIDTRRLVRKFVGHTAQITDATFSPDSRWLVTSSMDCSIRTWDIPSSQMIDEFSTEVPCVSLSLSPTGDILATAHVDYLGIFLWTNRTTYAKISLKALTPTENPPLVSFPECLNEHLQEKDTFTIDEGDDTQFVSREQVALDLVTLSGLATSRWQNLLNLDIIKKRNKPKSAQKHQKQLHSSYLLFQT